jgi:predicted Ser/Thr protein kinase
VFEEFYGMEDAIQQIVSYFCHAAQGLEEKKQILYLLGPVGGGKSSLAERLKALMQEVPFYAIKGSPILLYSSRSMSLSSVGLKRPKGDSKIGEPLMA